MEVIYEVSFSNRSCHDLPQKKLKGTDSPMSPGTEAWEWPSVGRCTSGQDYSPWAQGHCNSLMCVDTDEPSGILHYSFS